MIPVLTSAQHATKLVHILRSLADLVESDPSKVHWKEVQKIARYIWQGSLIGRILAHQERKRK
jgi:uncharacterized hydantoinase/oxoprolinase family protein